MSTVVEKHPRASTGRSQQKPRLPQVTVSARVNAAVKQRAQAVVEKKGLTLSAVFQQTLEQIARTGEVPELEQPKKLPPEEIMRRLEIFKRCTIPELCYLSTMTDGELREMRLREKYGEYFNA